MSAQRGDEYTPTTEDVRQSFTFIEGHGGEDDYVSPELEAEFDRWLSAHDREQFAAGVRAAREAIGVQIEQYGPIHTWNRAQLQDALATIDALQDNQSREHPS